LSHPFHSSWFIPRIIFSFAVHIMKHLIM
jgi:hypothetical protein